MQIPGQKTGVLQITNRYAATAVLTPIAHLNPFFHIHSLVQCINTRHILQLAGS